MDSALPVAYKTEKYSLLEFSKSSSQMAWYMKDGMTAIVGKGFSPPLCTQKEGESLPDKQQTGADEAKAVQI